MFVTVIKPNGVRVCGKSAGICYFALPLLAANWLVISFNFLVFMRTIIPPLLLLVAILLLALFIMRQFSLPNPEVKSETNSSVLLERINKVYKMVVIEGEFTELLSYKDYYGYDLPGFRKKAIIKVDAKVLVGYNLDSLRIEIDETNKVLKLQKWPEPEILAIDSDISYYDIDNGWFNSFTPEELTKLTKEGKELIRKKANESKLIPAARKQAQQMFDMITVLAESNGYTVEIDGKLPVNKRNITDVQSFLPDAPVKVLKPHTPTNSIPGK